MPSMATGEVLKPGVCQVHDRFCFVPCSVKWEHPASAKLGIDGSIGSCRIIAVAGHGSLIRLGFHLNPTSFHELVGIQLTSCLLARPYPGWLGGLDL